MINLDDLSVDASELVAWADLHACPGSAELLFPDRPRGYVKVTATLVEYARTMALQMECRLNGEVVAATRHGLALQRIYRTLPRYARW
jgi:hypothetical protein